MHDNSEPVGNNKLSFKISEYPALQQSTRLDATDLSSFANLYTPAITLSMHSTLAPAVAACPQQHEFSHTIIHGRPQPGQLVVALPSDAAPLTGDKVSEAAAEAAAGAGDKVAAAAANGGRIRLSAPAALGPPQKLSAMPPAAPKLSGPGNCVRIKV